MKKAKVILDLEKELKCRFYPCELSEIERYSSTKESECAFDNHGNITGIILCGFDLSEIPKAITENINDLHYLRYLNLLNNRISDISPLRKLTTIQKLELSGNQICDISPLKDLKNIQKLKLSGNQIIDISPLYDLKSIQSLNIINNQISDLSALKDLKNLRRLHLYKNSISFLPTWITDFPKMKKPRIIFDLEEELFCSFELVELLDIVEYKSNRIFEYSIDATGNLTGIAIRYLDLNEIPKTITKNIENLTNLISLNLFGNKIRNISPIKDLKNIRIVSLTSNQIHDISPLKELKNIQILWLNINHITDISPLKELKKLERLDLQVNSIKTLPEWIIDFPNMDVRFESTYKEGYITCNDNPIENIPIEIIKQGKAAIKAWFEEQKKTKSIPNPYVKLILTGNTTVGKTSLINFLTNQTFSEGEISTHGINQTTWKPTNTNLDINIWDFGGQEYYHSTHQLFFSNNALYLLMFDKQHNCSGWLQTEIDYSNKGKVTEELEHFDYFYWLRNIRNLSDKSKILMVQNKVENPDDEIYPSNECFDKEKEFQAERPFKSTSVLNAYNYFKENHEFSHEFEELQKLIISKLNEVKQGEIFEYYLKAKELIETTAKTKPVVSIAEFIEICKPANENIANIITDVDGNETEYTAWKLMCVYFHEIGVLLYYPDSPTLNEKIFIRPTFVTDTIYKVLNYKVKQAFGRFTFADAKQSLENNTILAQDIIELMSANNFKLIFNYPAGSENYIAPQYLEDKKPDEKLFHHITKNMGIGFVLEFINLLPKYILTEFMVNYGLFQKDDIIWKYGIVFEKYGTTAFVECQFNECKIIYKSDNTGEHIRLKYEVFETLRNINRNDKNLKIGLDPENAYSLEKVLRDKTQDKFQLFQIGYEQYKKQLDGSLEKLIDKMLFLEKELITTHDSEKKFALQQQIRELKNQIEDLRNQN